MTKRREKQLMKLGGLLTVALAVVMGAIGWIEWKAPHDEVYDIHSIPFAVASAQEAAPQAGVPAPTPAPTPLLSSKKDWGDFSTPAPTPRVTHIKRKISSKLTIDAEAAEPGVLRMQVAESYWISYAHKALADLLFQFPESKRSVENMGAERYDTLNSKGEFLLAEPGRIKYERYGNKNHVSEHAQVSSYFHSQFHDIDGKWAYVNREELEQELSFMSREAASRCAVEYALSMQPESFPFTAEAVSVCAVTHAQWDTFVKALYKENLVGFRAIPREGDRDYGGNGLYYVTLRFYHQGVPVYMGDVVNDSVPPGRVVGGERMRIGMGVQAHVLISEAGILCYDGDYMPSLRGPVEVDVLSLEQAVACFASEHKAFLRTMDDDVRFTIDRIYPMYMQELLKEGGGNRYALHPYWCFTDTSTNVTELNGLPYTFYLDAVTGRSILTM